MLGKRKAFPIAHDEVVEQPHVDQGQGLPEAPGDPLIRLAGLANPGRVIVSNDD
jgi:hypothetical protein